MTTQSELRDLESRPQRYWNVDGIPELMMGLTWMVWGGAMLLGNQIESKPVYKAYWLFVPALLALSGWGQQWATKKLKARFTYPRTGYVEYKEPSRKQRFFTAVIAALSAALLAATIRTGRASGMEFTIAPVTGVLCSLALLVASVRQKAPHLLALAGVALALALAAAALHTSWDGISWMFLWLGLAAAAIGGWRFRRYLAQHGVAEGVEL
ncbi:MAG: hypothetical protein HY821_19790 [Acidobacteria bacterium]|nr:hypothetical protein [Acidobacteriota bacterium]